MPRSTSRLLGLGRRGAGLKLQVGEGGQQPRLGDGDGRPGSGLTPPCPAPLVKFFTGRLWAGGGANPKLPAEGNSFLTLCFGHRGRDPRMRTQALGRFPALRKRKLSFVAGSHRVRREAWHGIAGTGRVKHGATVLPRCPVPLATFAYSHPACY